MKIRNVVKLMLLISFFIIDSSCVKDDDYSLPDVEIKDPDLKVTNTIKSIRDFYTYGTIDFNNIGEDLIIEGYVVSSDASGNIYKTISIQDTPENPTAAIQLAVDATKLHTFYEIGRKVYVKLKNLGMTMNRGVLEIGALDGVSVTRIASSSYKNVIVRSTELAVIKPLVINSVSEVTDENISMLIQLNNMKTIEENQTYANVNGNRTYSADRPLENCTTKEQIMMRNSGFSSFKAEVIPNKKGSIVAVLGKYNTTFQLFIRDTDDIGFTKDYQDCNFISESSLAEIRELFAGDETIITSPTKIKVVVTSDASKNNIAVNQAFAQDASAGIALNFSDIPNVKLGDEIEIFVKDLKLTKTNGLLQLNLSSTAIINKTKVVLPTPKLITLAQALTNEYESRLVTVEEVQFKDISKPYMGINEITSDCTDELSVRVLSEASFSGTQVNDKKGTITGVLSNSNGVELYIRDLKDVNFAEVYSCTPSGGGVFDFEDIKNTSTSYTESGVLNATDGVKLEYIARTSLGKYAINGKGLMLKNEQHIKLTFPSGVQQLKFKCRGAFTNKDDRVILINEGDENSTIELKKEIFAYDVLSQLIIIELNKTGMYTLTIKGGTAKQVVVDDVEWTN